MTTGLTEAHAQEMPQEAAPWRTPDAATSPRPAAAPARPPPTNVEYVQYGATFVAEFNLNPGAICPKDAKAPCILGSGGGLSARAGYRSRGPWYIGGAYEFNRVDTSGLMRLGVLQQLRIEMRHYMRLGQVWEPYVASGLGVAALGNEWAAEAAGLTSFGGFGLEIQLSRTTVVGAAAVYRPVLLFSWTDRAQQHRDTGVAHFVGLELILEAREALGSH
jgi:hypothetical protein